MSTRHIHHTNEEVIKFTSFVYRNELNITIQTNNATKQKGTTMKYNINLKEMLNNNPHIIIEEDHFVLFDENNPMSVGFGIVEYSHEEDKENDYYLHENMLNAFRLALHDLPWDDKIMEDVLNSEFKIDCVGVYHTCVGDDIIYLTYLNYWDEEASEVKELYILAIEKDEREFTTYTVHEVGNQMCLKYDRDMMWL